ncbi:enoyl-CoA hydratase/carnithine racemase [Microbacterium sp. W4I20]|nr:enoyl-CoA hydratase/isomerase family protein [Microbacterium sp. W4I20]MDQ0727803.1 enoyl-CoA hydratase/carnithine racemase [Microbacterium sp. W4I20]
MPGIRLERHGAVGLITIDRPEKLNAMTLAMYDELGAAFAEVRDDAGIGVAVLTGAGDRAFCVGADLGESIPALTEERFDISEWDAAHQKHSTLEKPVVAAINGLALGAGFEIMLSTDIRLAASHAEFGLPETGVGVVPAGGTLVRLVRQIPYAFAMDLMLRGERIDAETALRYGLVNRVVSGRRSSRRGTPRRRAAADEEPHRGRDGEAGGAGTAGSPGGRGVPARGRARTAGVREPRCP